MGCHFLLQGIFLTQGSNSCLFHLLHCRHILYHLSHQGSLYLHINIQEHRFEFEPRSDNLGLNPQTCIHQMRDLNNAHLLVAQMVKNLPAMWETWVRFLSQSLKDPLEEGMATHSCILAWRIPWMEGPGRLQSRGITKYQT